MAEWRPYAGMLPEGAVPTFGLRLISYVDPSGTREWMWNLDSAGLGDSWAEMLGLLELVKVGILDKMSAESEGGQHG